MEIVTQEALKEKPSPIRDDILACIKPLFSALLNPECAQHIPARVATELASTALDVIRKGEASTWEDFSDWSKVAEFKNTTAAIAELLLHFADQMKETLDRRNENITTSTPITASKPIVLTRTNTPSQAP